MAKLQTLHMTPAELAVNERIEADLKAGVDPFGEEDDDPQDTDLPVDETPPANTNAEATDPPADPVAATPAEPVAAAPAETPPAAAPVEPVAAVPEDFGVAPDLSDLKGLVLPIIPQVDVQSAEAKIADLQTKIDEAEAKFEDGTLSPAERNAQVRPLEAQVRETERNLAVSLGRQAAAIDHVQSTQEQVLGRLRTAGARDGLDYGQPGAASTPHASQFDLVTQALYANPKNAGKTWVEMASLADAQVRAMNGIAPKPVAEPAGGPTAVAPAAKPVVKPVAARAAPPTPPQTLRDLPAAARSSEASETIAGKLAAANAHGKDALWNKMTRAQQLAVLGED